MAILVRAPFLAVFGALAFSLALFDRFNNPALLFLAPLLAAVFILCTYVHPNENDRSVKGQGPVFALLLIVALLCALRIFTVLSRPDDPIRSIQTEGVVSQVRPWGKRNYVAVLDTPEGGFLIQLPFATLTEGTRLKVEGITRPLSPAKNGGFDPRRYWRAQGVSAWLSPSSMEPLPDEGWNLPRLRYRLWRALVIYMPPLTGAYLRAAWTGKRDDALNTTHRAWGTSHLLAVSGFHVGIVILCASMLLGPGHPLALSLLLWCYILLTGAAPSALRAGLMFQAALMARLLGRPSSAMNGVCLATTLLLLLSPFLFWDIGWRLSVLAALTLTALPHRGVRTWLLASPAISLVTFPQVAAAFGTFPVVGLLLNLAAPTFFALALGLASAGAALYFTGFPLAARLLGAVEGGFILWGKMANGLAALVPWTLPWRPFLAWLGAGALVFLLCRSLRLPAGRTALLATAGALAAFGVFL